MKIGLQTENPGPGKCWKSCLEEKARIGLLMAKYIDPHTAKKIAHPQVQQDAPGRSRLAAQPPPEGLGLDRPKQPVTHAPSLPRANPVANGQHATFFLGLPGSILLAKIGSFVLAIDT